jgi:adenylate cyclase
VDGESERIFLIADLSGYTAYTEIHGGVEAARVVARYVELTRGVLHGGARIVERVGDELLLVADDVSAALAIALALREAIVHEPLFPLVRIGVHAGPVFQLGNRYFGAALNVTARLAAHARPGQVLCTERIVELAGGPSDVDFRALTPARFRNVAEPVTVFEVVTTTAAAVVHVDPVCRMQVSAATAVDRLEHRGMVVYFCSVECSRRFAAHPESHGA